MAMPRTTRESLFARADTSGGEDACWAWKGFVNRRYGSVSMGNRPCRAHRAAYLLCRGDIPVGMYVCHSCDNPLCINPKHLWLGSPKDNVDDMRRKGRHIHGEISPRAKLTADQAAEVFRLIDNGFSYSSVAKRFGVSTHLLARMRGRRAWKSVLMSNYYDEGFSPSERTGHTSKKYGEQVNTRNRYSVRHLPDDYKFVGTP